MQFKFLTYLVTALCLAAYTPLSASQKWKAAKCTPITTDNGNEFTAHLDITAGLRVKGLADVIVYFADSHCSWQKGAVENINKLIRQYIPKKSNFNDFSDTHIKNVAKKQNLRPSKNSVFQTQRTRSSNKSIILYLPVEPAIMDI